MREMREERRYKKIRSKIVIGQSINSFIVPKAIFSNLFKIMVLVKINSGQK